MNCSVARERAKESIASASGLPSEVRVHCNYCPECHEFFKNEQNLHSALDRALEDIMNQAVPASLVPHVRASLEALPARQLVWIPRFIFAATALASLFVCVSYLNRKPDGQPRAAHFEALPERDSGPTSSALPPARRLAASKRRTQERRNLRPPSDALPKVIISAEEQQAFARFVARIPEERAVAVALVGPAPIEADAPIEIALLDLGSVEVKPLKSETSE